jgi:Flp pilus assembly protein TadD
VQAWQKVVQRFKSPQAVLGVYGALSAQKKNEEAKKAALEWVGNNPKDSVVRGFLAERAIAAKDYREAITHYRTLLALAPNSPLVLNNLAWALHQLKDPEALDRAEAAVKLAPKAPAILDTLGVILLDLGQTRRSVTTLKQAVELAPKSAALHLNYARALVASGDKDGARRESAKAVELAPEGSPLRQDAERFGKG